MNLAELFHLAERLRKESIGEPEWLSEKEVYEYREKSAKVVAVLKITRAAHGVSSLNILCHSGLFIDFGAIMRCVNDAVTEVYFLLENYPETSRNVDQFVEAFFGATIDGFLANKTHTVTSGKIRSAMVRVLKGQQDNDIQKIVDRIFKTFSGYVHANYAHIMEIYNGAARDFNLAGVPSIQQRQMRVAQVDLAAKSVAHAAAYVASIFGLNDLHRDIVQTWRQA